MAYHWLDLPVRSGGVTDLKSLCEDTFGGGFWTSIEERVLGHVLQL